MSDRRAPAPTSFYDRTKQFMKALPRSLPCTARTTAVALFLHAKDDGTDIYITVEGLMEYTGLTRSSQFRALKDLIGRRYLVEDGWKVWPHGVKCRRRRLDLDAIMRDRSAECVSEHSPTNGTVGMGHSPTSGTLHSPTSGTQTEDTKPTRKILPSGVVELPFDVPVPVKPEVAAAPAPKPARQTRPPMPLTEAVAIWNRVCGGTLRRVTKLTPDRTRHLTARLAELPEETRLDDWEAACERVMASDRLLGRLNSPGPHQNWQADFDFIITERAWVKLAEGIYDNKRSASVRRFADGSEIAPGTV